MVELVGLMHVERIHVGAQPDRALAVARAQHTHHAGLGEAAVHFDAEGFQLVGDDVGGPYFLESRLGMTVNVMAPGGHVLVKRGNTINNRHPAISPKIWMRIVRMHGDGSSTASMRPRTSGIVQVDGRQRR